MSNPLVSVIIVTYNNQAYIDRCLRSVLKTSYKQKEILVVDNASTDNTLHILEKYKDKISLIASKKNLGYAAANNLGFEKTKGEYLLVLNPDTEVTVGCIEPLVTVLNENPLVAACQPAIYLLTERKKLNLSGKTTHYLGFDWIKDYQSEVVPPAGELISMSGCCVLLRKKIAEKAGYFDPSYFMYYEDSDLSWKLRLLGYSLWFEPKSKIYHDYKLFPPESYLRTKKKLSLLEHNRICTVLKNYQLKSLLILLPMFLFVELALIFFALFSGWGKEKLTIYAEIWQQRGHLKEQRKLIQSLRKVADFEIAHNFESRLGFIFAENRIVAWLLNPILAVYWQVAFRLL